MSRKRGGVASETTRLLSAAFCFSSRNALSHHRNTREQVMDSGRKAKSPGSTDAGPQPTVASPAIARAGAYIDAGVQRK